jgi:hypothetical protein
MTLRGPFYVAVTAALVVLTVLVWAECQSRPAEGSPRPIDERVASPASDTENLALDRTAAGVSRQTSGSPGAGSRTPAGLAMVASLELFVYDAGGHGLSSVCVRIEREGGRVFARGMTDENGEFRADGLGPGFYGISTSMGDTSVTIEEPRRYEVQVLAGELREVRGQVVDHERRPVFGAAVLLGADDSGHDMQLATTTDEDGRFVLRVAKAGCVLLARQRGCLDGPIEPATDGVTLRIGDAESRCLIKVVDEWGRPVRCVVWVGRENAIRILNPVLGVHERWPVGREYSTGTDGIVDVGGLAEHTRELLVLPLDQDFSRCRSVWEGLGEQVIQVGRACVVSGRVLDQGGHPVEGARVSWGPPRAYRLLTGVSDAEGRFELRGGPLGLHSITAAKRGSGSADATVACDAGASMSVTLVLGGKRRIRLVDDSGGVRVGVVIRLRWRSESAVSITDQAGEVGVPNSWWRELEVEVLGPAGDWSPSTVVASSDTVLTVAEAL